MPGGTSWYVSHAVRQFSDIDYSLVTAIGSAERNVTDELTALGIKTTVINSKHSVFFENIYGEDTDKRKQRVRQKADPFTAEQLKDVDADILHLGVLLADDFSTGVIKYLSGKGKVSVDSQGYLREVRNTRVYATDWKDKMEALKYVYFLKANEHEMEVLTGSRDAQVAAKRLYRWGVREVLLTFGSMGSLIYDGKDFYRIPAYLPEAIIDATGCGDTYMAGYLYLRAKGRSIPDAAHFASALSTLKIERSGPAEATAEQVKDVIENNRKYMPDLRTTLTMNHERI
jgi:sugar/nucleoside kinase (ribokinase family)